MTESCAICFDDITATTGRVETACHHLFHFSCLSSWFVQRLSGEQDQSCPCCRATAGEKERLSTEDGEEGEDGSESDGSGSGYFEDEGEELWLTRADLHDLLANKLGGTGVPDSLWNHFFDPDDAMRLETDRRLCFTEREIGMYVLAQGGRLCTEEEWEDLVERFGEEPEGDDESEDVEQEEDEAPAAAESAPLDAPAPAPTVMLTRYQMEDEVAWKNGAIGVSAEQWAELAGGEEEETQIFTRAELDAFLMREDQHGHTLSDEAWAALLAEFATPYLPEEEVEGEEAPPAAAAPEEPQFPPLRITWRRRADGDWERIVFNPEEVEPAEWGVNSDAPPPDDLVLQCSAAARRFQAVWRGYSERNTVGAVHGLLALRGM